MDRWGHWDDPNGGMWYEPDGLQIGIDSGEDEVDDPTAAEIADGQVVQPSGRPIPTSVGQMIEAVAPQGEAVARAEEAKTKRLIEAAVDPANRFMRKDTMVGRRMIEASAPMEGPPADVRRLIEAGAPNLLEIPASGIFGDDRPSIDGEAQAEGQTYTQNARIPLAGSGYPSVGSAEGDAILIDNSGAGRIPKIQIPMLVRALKVTSKFLQTDGSGDIVVLFERVGEARKTSDDDSSMTFETEEELRFAQALQLGSTITITVQNATTVSGRFKT